MQWFKGKIDRRLGGESRSVSPRIPDGAVVYAIGDIHGRADLLAQLLLQTEADIAASDASKISLVFLGDYVDRGADSRGVLEKLSRLKQDSPHHVVALKGNHEDALLKFLDSPAAGPAWATHGGRETLLSYGVAPPKLALDPLAWKDARDRFIAALPAHHLAFLENLDLWWTAGDYLFVHAGVRPGVQLHDQTEQDLLWIRDAFLTAGHPSDKFVVHGHTPVDKLTIKQGRVGIDTGAYATGVLTALKLYGEHKQFLQTNAQRRE